MLKKRLGLEAIEEYSCLDSYYKISSTLIIPEDCREIGSYAFYECERLREVSIPESVEGIGDWAFKDCEDAVIILRKPKNKYKIGPYAFWGCKDVKEEVRD